MDDIGDDKMAAPTVIVMNLNRWFFEKPRRRVVLSGHQASVRAAAADRWQDKCIEIMAILGDEAPCA